MIRTLFIITGAALVLALACLAGAAALGGRDMARNGWAWTVEGGDGDHIRFQRANGADSDAPDVTRREAWTGGESLTVDSSLDVVFVQGAEAGVVITGPQSGVDRVRIEGGRIGLKDGDERVTFGFKPGGFEAWSDIDRLRIVVTAPRVVRFGVEGSGDLAIRDYDQDEMHVEIAGSGELTATGRTRVLELSIDGSGEAKLASLVTTDARVDIEGSGEARIAPTGDARVSISGSGEVDLVTRPANLTSNISGSGDINTL